MDNKTPPTTASQKTAKPETPIGAENERILAAMLNEVRAPGTKLGLLARGIETDVRGIQDRLNAHGSVVLLKTVMGHGVEVPIKATVGVCFEVNVGDQVNSYEFNLEPGASNAAAPPKSGDMGPASDPTATQG